MSPFGTKGYQMFANDIIWDKTKKKLLYMTKWGQPWMHKTKRYYVEPNIRISEQIKPKQANLNLITSIDLTFGQKLFGGAIWHTIRKMHLGPKKVRRGET